MFVGSLLVVFSKYWRFRRENRVLRFFLDCFCCSAKLKEQDCDEDIYSLPERAFLSSKWSMGDSPDLIMRSDEMRNYYRFR